MEHSENAKEMPVLGNEKKITSRCNFIFWYSFTRSRYCTKDMPKIPLTQCLISVLTTNYSLYNVFRGAWTLIFTHVIAPYVRCNEPLYSCVYTGYRNYLQPNWINVLCLLFISCSGRIAVYRKVWKTTEKL